MPNYDTLTHKRSAYGQVANKSVLIKPVNFKNYPLVENLSKTDYDLVSYDENGNEKKRQHCLIKNRGTNMTDYKQFEGLEKQKKDEMKKKSKFISLEVGESMKLVFKDIKAITAQNPWSHELEDTWVAIVDDEGNEKTWTLWNTKIFDQFKVQNIQTGDNIEISRVPNAKGKSDYIVKKI